MLVAGRLATGTSSDAGAHLVTHVDDLYNLDVTVSSLSVFVPLEILLTTLRTVFFLQTKTRNTVKPYNTRHVRADHRALRGHLQGDILSRQIFLETVKMNFLRNKEIMLNEENDTAN